MPPKAAVAAAVAPAADAKTVKGKVPVIPDVGKGQRPGTGETMGGVVTDRSDKTIVDETALFTDRTAKTTPRGWQGKSGVMWKQVMLFVFPTNLEHPESTGRLELFARFGPVDEEGRLHGGIAGVHIHTNLEIRQMIQNETRDALFSLYNKPRTAVEVLVEMLVPLALRHNYTVSEVRKLLRNVATDSQGQMSFAAMQEVILENQRDRLKTLIRDGDIGVEKGPKVAFQSKASVFHLSMTHRKKMNEQEHVENMKKRTHNYACQVAGLEDQNLAAQLSANVALVRPPGDANDRWDRYCALRRVGKASYVSARNTPRSANCGDDGLADKHAGTASLLSASMHRHVIGNR